MNATHRTTVTTTFPQGGQEELGKADTALMPSGFPVLAASFDPMPEEGRM